MAFLPEADAPSDEYLPAYRIPKAHVEASSFMPGRGHKNQPTQQMQERICVVQDEKKQALRVKFHLVDDRTNPSDFKDPLRLQHIEIR